MSSSNNVTDVFILLLLGGILLPIGINQIFGANVTTWDAPTTTIFLIMPLVGVASIIMGLVQGFRKMRR